MKFPHFFIERPIFASVLSFVIVLIGGITYFSLPVSQYPNVAPPTIVVRASYPGATPQVIADTVATPIEQEMNGVDDMLYMESSSSADGTMQLTVTFKLGTDLDDAQVLVQNRVAVAEARLPEQVRQIGVTTRKQIPDMLMVVHLNSPDNSRDQLYISNYAFLRIRDALMRLDGVGDIRIAGGNEYSMRVWLDIEKMTHVDLTAGDVLQAIRGQNVQVAAGVIGQPPIDESGAFQLNVTTEGRLKEADEFGQIIVKRGEDGRVTRLKDVARLELGAQDYSRLSYLDGKPAVAILIYQRPGTNAVDSADVVKQTMADLSTEFPQGIGYEIAYNPTDYVEESINEVFETLFITTMLVVLTVFVFLHGWSPTIIPVIAIPISLIGTFAAMQMLGVTLNTLSLFGLVLAIGIVVDDAIVVVENVERLIAEGLNPREATHQAMDEVGSALIATTLVLIAVFVPTVFIPGISGQFYQQFALTIAISTVFSTFVSLTLSPAMCALLLRPKNAERNALGKVVDFIFGWFFRGFNRFFDVTSNIYAAIISRLVRFSAVSLILYVGLLVATWYSFGLVPSGFIPPQDQGYLIVSIQLPDGASLARTDIVTQKVAEIGGKIDGVAHSVGIAGLSGSTFTISPNAAVTFLPLEDAKERAKRGRNLDTIIADLRKETASINEAQIYVIAPPPVRGIGRGGGFKMYVQDKSGAGIDALNQVTQTMVDKANQAPGLVQVFSNYRVSVPQIFVDVDRTKAQMLDIPVSNVFEALQVYLGSQYVNDFNLLGRTYRVTAQAEPEFRDEATDILRLRTRSARGVSVSLGSVVDIKRTVGPDRIVRYNLYPAADINGSTVPGYSTGQSLDSMEKLAAQNLPPGFGYAWTEIAFQEKQAGNTIVYLFPLAVLFVFLALSAQYESWLLPLAIILIVPLCLLFAIVGIWMRGMDNNILTQIGFIVLVGLACKNAILIVEFAKAEEDAGQDRFQAAINACRLRLRPILMTAFSFILGVIPLLIATGAGFEMRRVLGTAVFSGMLGVTLFGLFLTPVFYVVLRRFAVQPNLVLAGNGMPSLNHDDVDLSSTKESAYSASREEEVIKPISTSDKTISPADFEKLYEGQPAWDIDQPQPAFVEIADQITGSVLDSGCGTGENALYFAERGCDVTGVDLLSTPIEKALEKAAERGLEATFVQLDALKLSELNQTFDNVLDSGLFHVFSDEDRQEYVNELSRVMHPGAKLYLQCFSDNEPAGPGPRRISPEDLHKTFDKGWEIESITPCHYLVRDDNNRQYTSGGPHAYFCEIRKRST
ncbi:multidrug efflux RND transporter permease subunit [Rubinisphaera italica]|uniref:Efflux pump membrane transporter BepE n=1 Tax=Rubinisphaera italica TaxID=2527969 RepID=A0A5C5XN26_9PLAN|nr:multidrug efflux RND transporter permease subunit [Rubinisphaera italica]TWT63881.1 Efflux pump membrane transporter BepE [Rubinisphaera italica]